jgi:peptidoglycan hydrolase CwlO-like protein
VSDRERVRDQPWAKNIPDYMLEAIANVSDARHDILDALKAINRINADLVKFNTDLRDREQLIKDREDSVVNTASDLSAFANKIYGPDSELTKILSKLTVAEVAATNREARHARQYEELSENQTRLKDWVVREMGNLESKFSDRFKRVEERLTEIERKSA